MTWANRWFPAYSNENREFDHQGLMKSLHASINDLPYSEAEQKLIWPQLRRPEDYASLNELCL